MLRMAIVWDVLLMLIKRSVSMRRYCRICQDRQNADYHQRAAKHNTIRGAEALPVQFGGSGLVPAAVDLKEAPVEYNSTRGDVTPSSLQGLDG